MLKEGKFGVAEAVSLVTITITTKIFFTSPAVLVAHVGSAAWYATLFSALTALVGFTFLSLLLKRFPNKNLVEIFDNTVGRTAGFLFSMTFAVLFIGDASTFLREFSEVLRSYTFHETSTSYIIGALVISAGIAAFLGLESIARVAKLSACFMLAGYMLLLVLAANQYNYTGIFPFFGYGLDKTVLIGIQRCSAYSEVAVLGVVAASLQGIKNIKHAGVISIIVSGLLIALGFLAELMLFSYTSAQENSAPLYALARIIKYGSFFTRLDPLFLVLWTLATAITSSVLFYASVSIFCQAFRLSDKRPVIVPMLVILFALAMAPRDFSTIVYGFIEGSRQFNWIAFFGLPLIALVAAVIRNKKDDASNA